MIPWILSLFVVVKVQFPLVGMFVEDFPSTFYTEPVGALEMQDV